MKEMVKLVKPTEKDPEYKEYLICIEGCNGGGNEWILCTGRKETVECIINNIDIIIPDKSFVLVEDCKLNERISVYDFMKKFGNLYDESFDIDEYINMEREPNDLSELFNSGDIVRLRAADIMIQDSEDDDWEE